MADLPDLAVGQEVVVLDGYRREPGVVTKVGRKLVTIQIGQRAPIQYRMSDRRTLGVQYGYGCWFRTLPEIALEDERDELVKALRSQGVLFDRAADISMERLRALAAVFESESVDG